jgi:hypothetical protein
MPFLAITDLRAFFLERFLLAFDMFHLELLERFGRHADGPTAYMKTFDQRSGFGGDRRCLATLPEARLRTVA